MGEEILSFLVKWEIGLLHATREHLPEKLGHCFGFLWWHLYSVCSCVNLGELPDLFIPQFSCEECLAHWLVYEKKAIAGSYGYQLFVWLQIEIINSKFTLGSRRFFSVNQCVLHFILHTIKEIRRYSKEVSSTGV